LLIVLNKASEFFREQLVANKHALKYVEDDRGFKVNDEDPFMIGYAPDGNKLMEWAKVQGLNQQLMIDA